MSKKLIHSATQKALSLRDHWICIVIMGFIACALILATGYRIQTHYSNPSTHFDWENRGFSDFHNGTYFPTRAFVDGRSPYSAKVASEYQMARQTPPYSPIVFLIHTPFAFFSLEVSRVLYFLYSVTLMGFLSWCCLWMAKQKFRWFDWLAILILLLISRPGHITLFTGYFTTEIVLGCLFAVH